MVLKTREPGFGFAGRKRRAESLENLLLADKSINTQSINDDIALHFEEIDKLVMQSFEELDCTNVSSDELDCTKLSSDAEETDAAVVMPVEEEISSVSYQQVEESVPEMASSSANTNLEVMLEEKKEVFDEFIGEVPIFNEPPSLPSEFFYVLDYENSVLDNKKYNTEWRVDP